MANEQQTDLATLRLAALRKLALEKAQKAQLEPLPTAGGAIKGVATTAGELPAIYGERTAAGKPGPLSDIAAGGAQAVQDIYGAVLEKFGLPPVITPEQYQQTGPLAGVTRFVGNIGFDPTTYAPLGAPTGVGRVARAAAAGATSGAIRSAGELGPTALGGVLGAAGGAAAEGLAKIPTWLQGQAPRALGFTQSQFRSAAEKARKGIGPTTEQLARESVDMGIISPFASGKGMAEKALAKEAEVGFKIGAIEDVLSRAKAGEIDVPKLINDVEMRLEATYTTPAMKEYRPAYERLLGELRGLEQEPTFKAAQALKTRLGEERFSEKTGETLTGERSRIAGRTYPLLATSMEEGVERGIREFATTPAEITTRQNIVNRLQSDLFKAQQAQQGAAKIAAFARDEYKPFIGTTGQVGKSLKKIFTQEQSAESAVQAIGRELETSKGLLEMLQKRQEIAASLPEGFGKDYEQLKRQYQLIETLKAPVERKEAQEATNRLFTLPAQLAAGTGGATGNVIQGLATGGLLEAVKRFGAPTMTWAGVKSAPWLPQFARTQIAPRVPSLSGMAAQGARREEKPKGKKL